MTVRGRGGSSPEFAGYRGRVLERGFSILRHDVRRVESPGLREVEDTVAVIPAVGDREGDAEKRVRHGHVRERDVARVRHVERIGDRVSDLRELRAGLVEGDGRGEVQGQ